MYETNYFFFEGSAVTAQIRFLRRTDRSFIGRKLCPRRLLDAYLPILYPLTGSVSYKRATFYFPSGDETAVNEYLEMPEHRNPGEVRDLHFKYCGERIKGSKEFDRFVQEHVPDKWRDRVSKSEKGIDIEICCDALKLASASRLDRLFLFTNDDDFLPLCRILKDFGTNISIIHLASDFSPNISLLREADSYDVIPNAQLQQLFLPALQASLPLIAPAVVAAPVTSTETALKPDAPPSDLGKEPALPEQSAPAGKPEGTEPPHVGGPSEMANTHGAVK